ncbi:hypothetical protein MKX03_013739 [Papaver bracteatum]|nr:hypothetical protein MKX03_013739 [Papaver bracteatum]
MLEDQNKYYDSVGDIAREDLTMESWNNDTCEDEWNTDGNCIEESEDCLGFESDCEMINGYCQKGENRMTGETESIEEAMYENPKIGMIFNKIDEAYEYYNRYARKIGFSVRKQRSNRNRSDRSKIHRVLLVCSCEGVYRKVRTPKKKRPERRFECKARKFEFSGILCAHALKVFHDLQYRSLPSRYYLKRWSREATNEAVFDTSGDLIPNDNDPSATECYSELSHISQRIVTKCCSKSTKLFDFTKSLMLGVEQQLEAHIHLIKEQESSIQKATSNTNADPVPNVTEEEVLRDPQKKVSRGQSRKRIKSSFEIEVQKNSLRKGKSRLPYVLLDVINLANEILPAANTSAQQLFFSGAKVDEVTVNQIGETTIMHQVKQKFSFNKSCV